MSAVEPVAQRGSLWHRLYHGETRYDFVGKRNWGFAFSGALLVISALALVLNGLNLGLEFKGGVSWEFPANDATTSQTREAISGFGLDGAKIQTLRSPDGSTRIRVQADTQTADVQTQVRDALATTAGVDPGEVSVTSVSATWGSEVTRKAVRALIVFLALLTIYISLRFEWKMAIAALVAMAHDVFISVGVYALLQFPVTPGTVIAFLTILGYSLYDTVVVFDRVRDNARRLSTGRATYSDIVNLSMNQVLMRSINTSLASLLPVLSLLVVGSWLLGAAALQEFALALFVGLMTGAYSSIFVATPIVAILKEREPRYRQARERLARTGTATSVPALERALADGSAPEPAMAAHAGATGRAAATPAPMTAAESAPARPKATPGVARGSVAAGTIPPRPRKKRRR